jgi:hypothetical protein
MGTAYAVAALTASVYSDLTASDNSPVAVDQFLGVVVAYFDLKNQACIVGVGESEYGRVLDDKSPVRLQTEALRAALADAGLTKGDIDGYNTSHGAPGGVDYDEFAMHTGTTAGGAPRALGKRCTR